MVHNGIEYGDMQLIAEALSCSGGESGRPPDELAEIFDGWNRGRLESFLIEITARIFRVKDPGRALRSSRKCSTRRGQKGTGKWTAQVALDLACPCRHRRAIDARVLSSMKDLANDGFEVLGTSAPKRGERPEAVHSGCARRAVRVEDLLVRAGDGAHSAGSREWK